jgi:ferrous iron transport protein A
VAPSLDTLAPGTRARIVGIHSPDVDFRAHLLNLGMIPGTRVRLLRRAPLGDPLEVELRGFRLGLRRSEAACIEVEPA